MSSASCATMSSASPRRAEGASPRRRHGAASAGSSSAELGLFALPFAEEDGGLGWGAVETMIVMEAFGKGLVREPYLSTVVICGGLVRHGCAEAARKELAKRIAAGDLVAAFAHVEREARHDLSDVALTARQTGEGFVLDGVKSVVPHGDKAELLFVSARTAGERHDRDGVSLFLVEGQGEGRFATRLCARRRHARRRDQAGQCCRARCRDDRRSGARDAAHRARRRRGDRGVMCGGGRRHECDVRHDRRLPQDAQAVWPADRRLPGAAAPCRRYVHRARAGTQHGGLRDHDGRARAIPRNAPPRSRPPR